MDNKHGFSLVELLVYIMVSSMLMVCTMHWITASLMQQRVYSSHGAQAMELCAAHDCIVRDIIQASADAYTWHCTSPSDGVWHSNGADVGWRLESNRLVRLQGSYCYEQEAWRECVKSCIATCIQSFSMAVHCARDDSSRVSHVDMNLVATDVGQPGALSSSTFIRNGNVI